MYFLKSRRMQLIFNLCGFYYFEQSSESVFRNSGTIEAYFIESGDEEPFELGEGLLINLEIAHLFLLSLM